MENINLKTALLNEQYEKIALFGENNDRKTWLVRQKNSNKIFVLKEIEIENISIYESLQYIKNRHLAAVKNIIEIENKAVVIEEYISGDILADKIENKNITKEDALDYTCQLFEVLSELEKVNIVHRDITPKNILISSDNVVKLIDFGISRKTKEGRTKDTTILGTAGYAAPEQFGFMQTDIRSDIYSIGVVFHEMLTGKMPEGNKCICYDYKEFIQKCINISPENRFQTACQAYEELMKNYDVVLSMPFVGHHEDFINMGLRCIETKMERRGVNPIHDFSLMKFYKKILQEENSDLVITYSIKPNVYGGLMCEKLNIPFYANVQGLGTAFQKPGLAQFATVLYKTAFKKVKTVFFENQVNADEFVDRKIISVEKETILNGAGINLEIYECKPYPKSDPPHFLYLGRIMKEKGMDELFSAAEKLHDDGYKFVLDLVGFFEDEYKERVELLESKGVVKFHGFQEEPRPYYATADCVVMPSYHEGMSNVNLEASATGRPVITTNIPGCRESVENEYTGWLCEPKSIDSLYEKMKAFLETDISKREVMGKYARQKMVDEFDKKIVVNDTIKALKL